ncbi:MAG: acyltransferase, partial [Pseudomonadales bacterium]|nr:acyltransferase [Pseudomonadales bacterium]
MDLLGTVRFLLACLVFFSHIPGVVIPINPGVVSVICFYFISGYLMKKSYTRFVKYSDTPVSAFYFDRCIKLLPQYWIVLSVTVIMLSIFGKSEYLWFLNGDINFLSVFLNTILIPTNYIFEPFSVKALFPHPFIPPAWSLATEFHFYLLMPLLFMMSKSMWLAVLSFVLLIQFSSFFYGGNGFNSNSFGYRYIFGVLSVFMFGYAFAEFKQGFYKAVTLTIWVLFIVFMLFYFISKSELLNNPQVVEVLLAGVLALPLGMMFS